MLSVIQLIIHPLHARYLDQIIWPSSPGPSIVMLITPMKNDIRPCSQRVLEKEDLDDQPFGGHIHLKAPQHFLTLLRLEEANASKPAFAQFHKKLSLFLNNFLPAYNIPLPDGKMWLMLSAWDTVSNSCFTNLSLLRFFMAGPGASVPQGQL